VLRLAATVEPHPRGKDEDRDRYCDGEVDPQLCRDDDAGAFGKS
jgi:hypothetical protein